MNSATSKIVLKSPREIELMRAAGRLVHEILCEIEAQVNPGATTLELDELAERRIRAAGALALFKGVENPQARFPFPASICSSVNEEVVHGIPSTRPLVEGDIVSIDCGVRLNGYCGDAARTFAVGRHDGKVGALISATREALELAIREIRPHVRWSQVARRMQRYIESRGFGVVREFVGHGIGREMHEEPKIPNYVDRSQPGADFELLPGMTLAIEPMVTAGKPAVTFRDADQWSVVTKDGSPAAHFEHVVAVMEAGASVLSNGS
jgi:methionyl aminopeptidase